MAGFDEAAERGEAALLRGDQAHARPSAFEPVSRNFMASGNAILAAGRGNDATWLCMKYGPHGGGHGHPDKLNFVLYGLGGLIAPDPGTANYGVPIQGGWFRTTLAHNTLTVDEKSQQSAEGRSIAFIATNGFSAVMAEAGKIYEGVRFYRTVALIGRELILFVDQIESEGSHVHDLAYHNRGQLSSVPPDSTGFNLPDKPGYSYLREVRAKISPAPLRLKFDVGQGKAVWWALAGGEPTTFITGTGVGRHTEDRIPMVIARREGKATAYLWAVYLGADGDSLDVQPYEAKLADRDRLGRSSVVALRAKTGAGTHVLVANPGGTTVSVGDLQFDATLAFLTPGDDGALRAKYLAR